MTGIEELDEKDIEEAIRRELDALDDLDIKDVESLSDTKYEKYTEADLSDSEKKFSSEEKYAVPPDSVQTFIRLLQSRNDKLEEELADAQDALTSASHHENVVVVNNDCETADENISLEVKEKVLDEIENPEKYDNSPEIKSGDEDISSLEEIALRDLKELEVKQHERSDQLENLFNEIKEDEILRHEKEEKMREENRRKANEEHRMKMDENQSDKIKIEEEARCQQGKLQNLQKQFESEIKDLERIQKEERLALAKIKSEEKRKRDVQREVACVTIQKNFRKFRVLSKYGNTLKAKREERQKRRQEELDALERKEKRLMEEAVQKAKEEEVIRLKEVEMEKRRKEEEKREQEKRKAEEELRKKLEIERKQNEERLEMERREQEEREREIEEERKKKKMREEAERHRIKEEKRLEEKRIEEKRIEEKKLEDKRTEEKRLEEKRLEEKRLKEQMKMQEELEQMKLQEKETKQNEREEINKQREDGLEQNKETKINQTIIDHDKSSEQETRQDLLQKFSSKKNDITIAGSQDMTKTSDLPFARSMEPNGVKDALNSSHSKNTNFEGLYQANDPITGISKEQKIDDAISQTLRSKENLNTSVRDYSDLYLEWESRRQEWRKKTILWSTLSKDEKTNVKSRSRPRRPLSASQKLPSISEDELLKSLHNKVTSLDKIVCINVKQLPARNLKIMSRCLNVKSVTVQNCSLLSAENFDNCKHLVELNLSDNHIHNISCQNVGSLERLDLRNNQLTSIHGLDGCLNLRSLFLDGNKITRIGTILSNKVIHLSLQNNQLITTKGLSTWKYLQILDCSNNHLSQVQELESCPLLRILKLRGNNLRKPPDLSNHVLLRELHLSENSISSLADLSAHWLPLLQHLYVDNNSLSNVCPLRGFPVLETLGVKNNLISDEENLLPGLTGCHQLRVLNIQGNPVCEDSNVRSGILKTLPKLKFLDGETLGYALDNSDTDVKTIYHPICRAQIIAQDEILERQRTEIESCQVESNDDDQIAKKLRHQSRHFEEFQEQLIKHRLEHENFEKPCANDVSLDGNSRASIFSCLTQPNKHNAAKPLENFESYSLDSGISQDRRIIGSNTKDASNNAERICALSDASQSDVLAKLNETAENEIWRPNHHQAATLIQARFRGYRIRRRYLEATKTAQYSDIELEEDDFNFDEEVDLNMFDMDEAALDSSWVPTSLLHETARDTSPHVDTPPRQQEIGYTGLEKAFQEDEGYRPFPRKQAWRSPESPVSSPNPRKMIPPIEAPSVLSEQTSPPGETHRSHRTTELSSEWGFRNDTTAELMLKRANRMKYNALRKKKLTDPGKRLQLFKKADESNKARGVQTVQKKKEKPRVDYFSGRPYGEDHQSSKNEEQNEQAKKEMTFSWVYDQAVLHKDQGEEILRDTRGYFSEAKPTKNRPERSPQGVSLPRMDPVILAGRNLPLVASPMSNPRTPSTGDIGITLHRKYNWQQTKTHSNPDLSRVGKISESRSGKSNSAEARIIRERNNIL